MQFFVQGLHFKNNASSISLLSILQKAPYHCDIIDLNMAAISSEEFFNYVKKLVLPHWMKFRSSPRANIGYIKAAGPSNSGLHKTGAQ